MIIQLWGNVGSGKSTIVKQLSDRFDLINYSIDDDRRLFGDGSIECEQKIKEQFVQRINLDAPLAVIETLGIGLINTMLYEKLRLGTSNQLIIILDVPIDVCHQRLGDRIWDIPFPWPLSSLGQVMINTQRKLISEKCYKRWVELHGCRVKIMPNVDKYDNQNILNLITKAINDPTHI